MNAGNLSSVDYAFAFADGVLMVTPAVLSVVPDAVVMIYGGAVPKMTYSVGGFVNLDTKQVVSGAPAFQTSATSTSATGVYTVQASVGTLVARDYSFQIGTGRLTITRAVLMVTPMSTSITYGGSIPKLSYTINGFVNGEGVDVVKGSAKVTTAASSKSPVASYPIVVQVDRLSAPNYSFSAGTGVLQINKAMLTVTASNGSMTYGGNLPDLSSTFTGFVNSDTATSAVTGAAKISTVAPGVTVGAYPIKATLGTLTAANYNFEFRPGILTVNPAPLTVTANSLSMKVGDALPDLTYSVTGMVNGDRPTIAVKGKAALSTTATKGSTKGNYPITVAQGTMHSANYTLSLVNGTLTVN